MKLTNRIQWGAFSDKHKNYIRQSLTHKHCVAEGAVRSGKTIDNCIAFAMYLEKTHDKIHLASGSSLPNAKLNIGDCNGFGLEYLFRGRCRWGKYKSNEALYVDTQTGQKIIIFSGGGKADSYKSILGNSYGGWIATEINEHYDSDDSRTSFIKVAMARQIASANPFTLWDLNPSNPYSSIYTEYIDKFKEFDWYLYERFNIYDNATISEDRVKEIASKYNEDSVWYKRDILGERAVAEGLVFPYFANDNSLYVMDEADIKNELIDRRFSHIIMGVDFGDNGSKYSFTLTGFYANWNELRVIDEWAMEKGNSINADLLSREFIRFYRNILEKWGYPEWIFCDSASNTLINTLRSSAEREGLPSSNITAVKKNELSERPKAVDNLLYTGRLKINKNCKNIIQALSMLAWDKKKPDIPEDRNIANINDYWDSFCYTFITHSKYIELRR